MAAHRYWALLVTARPGSGNGVGLAEVEMRATSGGADQCSGGTAGGASSFGQVPANAFDNDDATIWHNASTGGNPVRLSYDFGSPVTVTEVFVRIPAASGSGTGFPGVTYGPAACWVQWSDDGTAWKFGGPATDLSGLGNAASTTIESVNDTEPVPRVVGLSLRLAPGVPAVPFRRLGALHRYDSADGGPYRVAGTVVIDGTPATPASRRVRLFDKISGRLVREQWSAADGTFEFAKVRVGPWLLVVDDYTLTYEADAATEVLAAL